MTRIMIKLDRFFAWILFVSMLVYMVTGFGLTNGIINLDLSMKLHLEYLTYIFLVAFIFHSAWAIHLALKRWKMWILPLKISMVLIYLALITFTLYADFFYK